MNKPNQSITGITEIALRVHDLDLMRRFYEQVIGLEVLGENEHSDGTAIFFAVGAGNSHLALFPETLTGWYTRDKSPHIDPKLTTLSHFALTIALEADEEKPGYAGLFCKYPPSSSAYRLRLTASIRPSSMPQRRSGTRSSTCTSMETPSSRSRTTEPLLPRWSTTRHPVTRLP